ncbi:SDR family NAD(P)-dependent oxidoreductase [Altererythrobacter sp. MF3-039]|uniref:SDR family NAD(P)-dependent oxidoreductase n=1 Tax=Altererythrobacter sp. MF3-039 TaxID=3252901 RepID=UPI00390C4B34
MPENLPFEGRLALVTGSSKGIGAATAKALAAAGAHVILTGRDVKALEAVEDDIHAIGGNSTIAPLDMSEPEGITRLSSAVRGRWDALDILVLSAAYLPTLTPVTQIDAKQFSQAIATNYIAPQALLAAFDPMLKRSKAGRVIGLTSSVGASPRPYWSAYGSTKAAFENLLDSYAEEVERISEIRVAIVDPGATRTDMRAKAYPGEDPATVKSPEVVASRLVGLMTEDFETRHRERVVNHD